MHNHYFQESSASLITAKLSRNVEWEINMRPAALYKNRVYKFLNGVGQIMV